MFPPRGTHGLANLFGIARAEIEQTLQRRFAQMRLIAQSDDPMCQLGMPARPTRGALNGAEHAVFRRGIHNAICRGKTEAIKFVGDGLRSGRKDNRDLRGAQSSPLLEQMAEHGRLIPRQKQFGPAHSPRRTRGENNHAHFVRLLLHGVSLAEDQRGVKSRPRSTFSLV
jgi:hypothetical protein